MLTKAANIQDLLVQWRREIHMNPELGFKEEDTATKVTSVMSALGYRLRTGVGKTGVVAELGAGSPVIAIRADMDALPIQEANPVSYASKIPGVMHACGHDAHVAMALGAATLLAKEELPGTIRFLFQPAEEVSDEEGKSGAPRMLEDGALDGVDAAIALHVDSEMETGKIGVGVGSGSAGVDTFYLTIQGVGGHGSTPHKVIDPIHLSGHVILALHGIISRRIDPTSPAVISIGSIHGGSADNIIPESVKMVGTIRYMEKDVQVRLHEEINRAAQVAKTLGGDFHLKIEVGCPSLINHPEMVKLIRASAAGLIGAENTEEPGVEMGAEDFSIFSEQVPSVMFQLGCRIEHDERRHHDPRFDIDETCLVIGTSILTESALRFLNKTC